MKLPPVSACVRLPKIAFAQSALEKKSTSTLNYPHMVQRNGKAAMISQNARNDVARNLTDSGCAVALLDISNL